MPQTLSQRKALARLRSDMSLERAPLPPIYSAPFARKAKAFFAVLAISVGLIALAVATAYVCITWEI